MNKQGPLLLFALVVLITGVMGSNFSGRADTGFVIGPQFQAYYNQHDGLRVLGNPISLATALFQYFEKARIEVHNEHADPLYRFEYGLLVGQMADSRVGLPVGGDTSTVTYATIQSATSNRVPAPQSFSHGAFLNPDGSVFVPFSPILAKHNGYIVPSVFWSYMNQTDLFPDGWLHAFGLPVTEKLSATVTKGGVTRTITLQAFQRTVLTFDPLNPAAFEVERANVGTDFKKAFPSQIPLPQPTATPTLVVPPAPQFPYHDVNHSCAPNKTVQYFAGDIRNSDGSFASTSGYQIHGKQIIGTPYEAFVNMTDPHHWTFDAAQGNWEVTLVDGGRNPISNTVTILINDPGSCGQFTWDWQHV